LPKRLIILLLVALGVVFILKESFNIKTIDVKSPQRAGDIQIEVKKLLDSGWRQHNVLTLDSGALESALVAADPMIKTATITRAWPSGITVAVTLKAPSLGWSTGNQAYLLDRDGSAIGTLPSGLPVPVVVDGSNLPVQLGQRVTTTRFVAFVTDVSQALPGLKITPARYEVKDTTLDLYVTTAKGYQLVLDTSRSSQDELAQLQALLAYLKNQTPSQYIDLRIAGKAYYK